MSTRTTFEDRLLKELQREIGLREAGRETGDSEADTSVRRPGTPLLSPRRIAVAATACALAGLTVVVVPGTPADSVAYAVERHGDGRVTLTLQEVRIDRDEQLAIARELRPNGIEVEVLEPGYICKAWGTVAALDLVTVDGKSLVEEPAHAWRVPVRVTLSKGNVLVFENTKGSAEPRAVHAYEVDRYSLDSSATGAESGSGSGSEPCVPVKPTP